MNRSNLYYFSQLSFFILIFISGCTSKEVSPNISGKSDASIEEPIQYALVIHGGAGTLIREDMTPDKDAQYRSALDSALTIGENILLSGGTAADAVEKTINYLEDVPLFNAGKGAVYTADEHHELDASFMDGATLEAGAVGGITNIKHPISAARAVMLYSEHVMLTGQGAEQFAQEQGLDTVSNTYFDTPFRYEALQKVKALEKENLSLSRSSVYPDKKFGTVGCVALDTYGNIVAGTSTGGMTNKKYGRVGDSPIIGAGTYANNSTCGVSCTGHGEFFIRYAVAYDVHAHMAYTNIPLNEATHKVVNQKLVEAGGSGGLIAVDKFGNIAMTFNTPGMYRGYVKPGKRVVSIYKDEPN